MASQNESTVAEVRRLVYDLRPAALDDLGLIGAVRDYASGFSNLNVEVNTAENGISELPAAIEVAAYRIATEALTNVARHAKAKNCTISMVIESRGEADYLCLEIEDDGTGIPQNRNSGVGLMSMRERAEEIGGEFEIESSKRGTKLIARLPLSNQIQ